MQRLHQCAVAVEAALPGSFREKVEVLHRLAPKIEHGFVAIFLSDFVASYGLHDFDFSLDALRGFTKHGSAEFAVRPFLIADQKRALKTMRRWAEDECEHVRRLASEGSRPRLPWGMRLPSLVTDPSPTAPILEALKGDSALYVRKSVANHLNDITKDHPEWVMQRLEAWDLREERQSWIAKHACRTLIKRGHPRALQLFGFAEGADVGCDTVCVSHQLVFGPEIGDLRHRDFDIAQAAASRDRLCDSLCESQRWQCCQGLQMDGVRAERWGQAGAVEIAGDPRLHHAEALLWQSSGGTASQRPALGISGV